MRVLHISSNDVVGGRFSGYCMIENPDLDDDVYMAVWNKTSDNSHVKLLPPSGLIIRKIANFLMKVGSRFSIDGLLGFSGHLLAHSDYFKNSDVVHLHLVHGFTNISLFSLPLLSREKPLIWTLHDPWAMTGGCEHSFDCEKWQYGCKPFCPYPRCKSLFQNFAPYFHWKIKRYIYSKLKVKIIVASDWMLDRVKKSPLLNAMQCEVIPFGVDLNVFTPKDRMSLKRKMGIPLDNAVISFRDPGIKYDKFKGARYIKDALSKLVGIDNLTVLVFEDGQRFMELNPRFDVRRLGWVGQDELADALAVSDVFIMPSIQEAFGLMAVEAMACGTPVVVAEGTSLPSVIKENIGGITVPQKNSDALARAIEFLLKDNGAREAIGLNARKLAESEYSIKTYMDRHFEIYKSAYSEFHRQ